MLALIINMSRFVFIILALYFMYLCIRLYRLESYKPSKDKSLEDDAKRKQNKKKNKDSEARRNFYKGYFYKNQKMTILGTHFLGFMILVGAASEGKTDLLILYVQEVLFFMLVWVFLKRLYYKQHYLLWNISLYLLSISFIILARIDYHYGYRQFMMAAVGYIFALLMPVFITHFSFLNKLGYVYIGLSITLLVFVTFIGIERNGATNWIIIGDTFSFQPSEMIKILFVFFLAAFLSKYQDLGGVISTGVSSLVLIILLVFQKDLGTALIFFVIYVTVTYIATNKSLYFLGGLAGGSVGAFIAYKFYSHVQVRVEAWLNPWADVDNRGYQIAQSLFAIGAGGWFGNGLTKGMPRAIPAVSTDFIFAAICEEFGNILSIVLIIIMSLFFIEGLRIAKEAKDVFYLLVASGISLIFAFQIFLIIGGVTKLIPSTGVTLPFISSGGTSLVMSIVMLGILEGIHMLNSKKTNPSQEK